MPTLPAPTIHGLPDVQKNLDALSRQLKRYPFRAYRSTALALANGGVVAFNATAFDSAGWVDVATGRFAPRVAGVYRLSALVTAGVVLTAGKRLIAQIRKNGSVEAGGTISWQVGAVDGPRSLATVDVQANGSTDYFDVAVDHDNGGTVALAVGSAVNTNFCGELIERA